jgi:putative transcriptional regulator
MKPLHELENQVRKFRRAADLTQEQLAEKVGVTRQTIVSIEKGNYTPSVALALQIAAVLRLRVEELFQLKKGAADAQCDSD